MDLLTVRFLSIYEQEFRSSGLKTTNSEILNSGITKAHSSPHVKPARTFQPIDKKRRGFFRTSGLKKKGSGAHCCHKSGMGCLIPQESHQSGMAHHIHLPGAARHDKSINRRAVQKLDIRFDGNPLLGKNLSSLFGDKITPGIETGERTSWGPTRFSALKPGISRIQYPFFQVFPRCPPDIGQRNLA